MLELQSIITAVKNSQKGFYSRFEQAEKWTDEPENRTIFTKSEKQKIKRIKKSEQSLRN